MSMLALGWPEAEQRIAEVARTRRGRHRDKALASYRRTRAMELRAEGLGYAEIAQAGWPRQQAHGAQGFFISQALEAREAREARDVDTLRHVHFDRLEARRASVWPTARQGHVPSTQASVKIIEQGMRLAGLTGGTGESGLRDGWDDCQGPPTVVERQDDWRHAGCGRQGKF